MGFQVGKDVFVTIGGIDLSDHLKEIDFEVGTEPVDDTVMGDDTRSNMSGLKVWNVTLSFAQDFDAAKVDDTLYGYADSGAAFALVMKPTSGAVAAGNPSFTGQAILENYKPMAFSIGDFMIAPLVMRAAGDMARATT